MKELNIIQTKLNAPKDKFNKFGNYAYRSAEGILEALKPLLKETKCTLTITDDIELIGDRIYVKATAMLTNEAGDHVSTVAYAREEESKKGMDSAQVTGATSSYARKYALNGLFCIDDNKDPDTEEYANQQKSVPANTKTTQPTSQQEPHKDDEEKMKKILQRIPGILNLDESQMIWNEILKQFPDKESPYFKKLKTELGKKNAVLRQNVIDDLPEDNDTLADHNINNMM